MCFCVSSNISLFLFFKALQPFTLLTLYLQPCNGQQTQTRFRKVLRKPGNYNMRSCTDQTESLLCERMKNCIEYSWELSDWKSCLVNGGDAQCGVGHKERYAWCKNERNEMVDSYKCEEVRYKLGYKL